ncbi:MAG: 2-C-methyl-D-erythritol 2,4-cyclodiphosphate synthase [Gammaproteobacteria bacterium]|nr:2-C-methyl-D-erythritol 2,4-cyclodiphosphate synthase [Gammaproteobacteria bacterium]
MSFRIGQGIDVHAFGPGGQIILGGVVIPYSRGLVAHSDGDVLLHALMDALLGALALGDIGQHFPDSASAYSGIDSRELLCRVMKLVLAKGYHLVNTDITLIAEAPKMAPYIEAMRGNIAMDCQLGIEAVSVKATTSEKLGFIGRGEGIAAQVIVLLDAHNV